MKALKSPLARTILADPRAKSRLRSFIAEQALPGHAPVAAEPVLIEVRAQGRLVRVAPRVVPKAA